MSAEIGRSYQFEEFTVDGDQKVLLRNGSPLPLAPKVFDTLLILIGSSGRIVGKQELMSRLWPDSFVEESNLTFNIQQLRKALGDSARQPRFVETVARRGYRFVAAVTETESKGGGTAAASQPLVAEGSRFRRSYLSIGVVLLFLIIGSVVLGSWFARKRVPIDDSTAPLLSRPFKSEKFGTRGFVRVAITPDGKYAAYTQDVDGKASVWLRQLETSENIQIVPPSNERYLGIAVSRDGNSIYFVRQTLSDPPVASIYRVATFGGIPSKIKDIAEGTVSASPDDKQLSFTRCNYQDDDFCSLMLVDVDGQNERNLLTRRRPIRLSGAQFSPDGSVIAFASGESWNGGSDFRLMTINLATGVERQLAHKVFFDITSLKWLPDGNGLLVTAKENHDGRLRIWYVSASTGEAQALTQDATDYIALSLNKAADKLIATYTTNTFHLYTAKVDNVSNPRSLASGRHGLAFTPDGKIVYEGNDGDIWIIRQDGGEQRQLTNNPASDFFPTVSSDGRFIYFSSTRTGSTQVWRMNIDGSNQTQMTKHEGGYPVFVTADGQWIYFDSGLHQTLWRVSSKGGDETRVSDISVRTPVVSHDGRWAAYFFRDTEDNRLKIGMMSTETGKLLKVFALSNDTFQRGRICWLPDNTGFYYVAVKGSQSFLWRQSLDQSKAPEQIANLGAEEFSGLALSPVDGSFAFIRGKWVHEAVLIEGLNSSGTN